ncbi:regulator of telomere elongation helicase 1 [Strigomonas culicis]|uniref:Regulator of telomere elongation helicase 1 n=1 Tax=Strigomonas culicis TaxID=28005 RepID=S9USY9_9TRYP|nr:regulator of telomere elongation helicase 1 [Strigomonas culicis]|eukprot:EPY32008.1 regulator of telomere elongation helicase 1 [Strigomonas culicis]
MGNLFCFFASYIFRFVYQCLKLSFNSPPSSTSFFFFSLPLYVHIYCFSSDQKAHWNVNGCTSMASVTFDIEGVNVEFPFTPYDAQLEYMRSVMTALKLGVHGLLESPTGTGKTMSLLCATLAYRLAQKRRFCGEAYEGCRIIYCSRTHAQLAQVIRELKRTAYAKEITMAVLGSREHLCVNNEVLKLQSGQAQQSLCNALRADKNCRFYRTMQMKNTPLLSDEAVIHDIEDITREGRKCVFCPYYYERDASKEADIVFMPYNYMFDPSLRRQMALELKSSIIIIDEAHNLGSVLNASACQDLLPLDLSNAIHDCSRVIALLKVVLASEDANASEISSLQEEFASLKIVLTKLEALVLQEKFGSESAGSAECNDTDDEVVRPGSEMYSFLLKALITRDVFEGTAGGRGLNDALNKAVEHLAATEQPACGLPRVQQFLTSVFTTEEDNASTRFVLRKAPSQSQSSGHESRILGFWRLDTSGDLQAIASACRTLLLTSGTLSPLDHFAAELGVQFDVCLVGSHVIQPGQVVSAVLTRGPGNQRLNGSYAFRNSVDYRIALGMSLVNVCRNVPGGTLVFFPSYIALNGALDLWRAGSADNRDEKTVWGMLTERKPVFVEPASNADLKTVINEFQSAVDSNRTRGAILLAVCRGKISEGVDFSDHHGRCVIVTGIPFANNADLFIRLKRDYLNRIAHTRPSVNGKPFTGEDWYRNEAFRAVNQCLGRVIRHKDDYGALVLADERFRDSTTLLSSWIARETVVHSEFRLTYAMIAHFFQKYRPPVAEKHAPFVILASQNDASGDATVPDSSDKAKTYAAQKQEKAVEHQKTAVQKAITEASEKPETLKRDFGIAVATARTPIWLSKVTMPKQSVSTAALAQKKPLPDFGNSSREFCAFLKSRLDAVRYDEFKDTLKKIRLLFV